VAEASKSNILIAVVGALSAVVVAAITTFGTIAVSAPEARKVRKELEAITPLEQVANLPIGTIAP
jgi:hypothetical protein